MASQLNYLNGAPVLRSIIEGRPRVILVDTGSSISLIQPGVSASNLNQAIVTPFGITGDELQVKGEQRVPITVNGKDFVHVFCVYYNHRGGRNCRTGFPEKSGSLYRF